MLENPAVRPQPADPAGRGRELLRAAPVIAGFLLLAAPTIFSLSHSVWTREDGAHGPIILFTGAWLISREANQFRELGRPGSAWVTAAARTIFWNINLANSRCTLSANQLVHSPTA